MSLLHTIEQTSLLQIGGREFNQLLSESCAEAARIGYDIGRREALRDKPENWLRHKQALEKANISKTSLQKLKVVDGGFTPGRIRYRVFARNDHRYSYEDILTWIASKKPKRRRSTEAELSTPQTY